MDYTEFFRQLRIQKGFTHDTLANLAGVHRNTVINLEQNRQVKFKTVALLLKVMGYDQDSPEIRRIALLWLEGVSGIHFTLQEVIREKKKMDREYRKSKKSTIDLLNTTISERNLTEEKLKLLLNAVENPEIMDVLKNINTYAKKVSNSSSVDMTVE
ncbi:MAG: helix-turn-helix domain-containing protein [Opitutales bacterium]|nr:helix-turn-helix domain-containing protein [Opitutales bacterium]MCH8539242.1 helix-turn-helix domain-containing protein [Opitutales bacterium]